MAHLTSQTSSTKTADTNLTRKPKLNLDQVMIRMIELLLRHDPQTLNYSKISRFIGVPRATLYYYFGSNLNKTFEEIARFGFKHFAQMETLDKASSFKSWEDYQNKRLEMACSVVTEFPWAPRLYFRYRESQNSISAVIRDMEKKYLAGIRSAWKHFHKSDPNRNYEQISSSVKLGFLFGLALEVAEKRDHFYEIPLENRRKLIQKLNNLCTEFLNLET